MKIEQRIPSALVKIYPDMWIKETGYSEKEKHLRVRTVITFIPRIINGETRLFEVRKDISINMDLPFDEREKDWHFAIREFFSQCIDVAQHKSIGNSSDEKGMPYFE